jgi:hypothetical protein
LNGAGQRAYGPPGNLEPPPNDLTFDVLVQRVATVAVLNQNRDAAVALTNALLEADSVTGEVAKEIWARHGGRRVPKRVLGAVLRAFNSPARAG